MCNKLPEARRWVRGIRPGLSSPRLRSVVAPKERQHDHEGHHQYDSPLQQNPFSSFNSITELLRT